MLEMLFRSRVMVKLIAYFIKNPESEAYLREVSREVGEPASAALRELDKLEELGLISSRRHGNHKYFRLKADFPLLPELKSIFLKTEGAADYLSDNLKRLPGVQLAFAYGGFAKQPALDSSRIDLVVVGSPDRDELDKLVKSAQVKLGRKINYINFTAGQFKHLLEAKDPVLSEALKEEKLVLVANVAEKARA